MKFTLALVSLAALASASPAKPQLKAVGGISKEAQQQIQLDLCDTIGECVAALAPTVVACAAALAEGGANPLADAACIAAAVNTGVNQPEACDGCF